MSKHVEKTRDDDPYDPRFLEPGSLTFNGGGDRPLTLCIEKENKIENLKVLLAFPLSKPHEYVVLLDGEGKEVGLIRCLSDLPRDSRRCLEEELDRKYYTPVIRKVRHVKTEGGLSRWEVETDRGPRDFLLRGSRENVIDLEDGRMIISDIDNNRYEIPDISKLDAKSYERLVRLS